MSDSVLIDPWGLGLSVVAGAAAVVAIAFLDAGRRSEPSVVELPDAMADHAVTPARRHTSAEAAA
jgi:hypothetical protein